MLIHSHSQQIFSADFLSRSSQQIFFSRSSRQIFLADFLRADLLSRSSQQISEQIPSADLLSRFSQQIFSADLLSRFSQRIFSADLFSRSSQQIFFSRSSQQIQIFSAFMLLWSGGWWSAISYHVGGQYCTSSPEGPFRGAFGKKKLDFRMVAELVSLKRLLEP